MQIRKNDSVMVISGRERGKPAKCFAFSRRKTLSLLNELIWSNANLRPRGPQQPGGIVEKEASIHVSNIMMMCDKCNAPVRIGRKILADGKKIRICRRCGEALD